MSLDNSQEYHETQEKAPEIVLKYKQATVDEYGNIQGEPILQNCSATIRSGILHKFNKAEWNSGFITQQDVKLKNEELKVVSFNPSNWSIECEVDGLLFKWNVEPYYKNNKYVWFIVYSKSDLVTSWSTIKKGLKKIKITDENISNFNRYIIFDLMDFHTDNINLGRLYNDSFENLYAINEDLSVEKSSGNVKAIVAAIISAGLTYGAMTMNKNDFNSSVLDIQDFASETRQSVTNTLSIEEEKTFSVAASKVWYIRQLESYDITDFDASKFPKEWAKAGDKLFITYSGDKLIKMINQRWEIIYAL